LIYQPGNSDSPSREKNVIGQLEKPIPIKFGGPSNRMDAAVARVKNATVLNWLCGIGTIKDTAVPEEDDVVRTSGRTSGYTKGIINEVGVDILIGYGTFGQAHFVNQVRIVPVAPQKRFSSRGDSGAVVVKGKKRACALLFAGDNSGSIATPIIPVLKHLKATIS
jgi:hypothetical protein